MSEFARGRSARGARSQRLREARAAKRSANQPEIVRVAREHNVEEIRRLLEEGHDPNTKGTGLGYSPLHIAAKSGDLGMMEVLINHGANPNAGLKNGIKSKTPLICAIKQSQTEAADYLVEHGADPDGGREPGEETPLLMAAKNNNLDLVKTLIKYGANVNVCFDDTALHKLTVAGNEKGVEFLLKNGAFVDAENMEGKSALVDLSEELDREAVQPDKRGRDPYVQIINLLLYHGADVNMISKDGTSVLSNAIEEGSLSLVKFWVERAGADARRFSLSSYVIMSKALWLGGSKRVMKYLLDQGSKFDINDRYGQRGFGLEGTGEAAEIKDLIMKQMKYNIDGSDGSDSDDPNNGDHGLYDEDASSSCSEFYITSGSDDDDDELADPQELKKLHKDVNKMMDAMHLLGGMGDDDDDDIDPVKAFKFLAEIDKTGLMKDSYKQLACKERRWIKDNPEVAKEMYLKASTLADHVAFRRLHKFVNPDQDLIIEVLWSVVKYKDSKKQRNEIATLALGSLKSYNGLMQTYMGYTIFSTVCANGHIDILNDMLKLPVANELIVTGSPTPVWLAANSNQDQVLSLLLEHLPDPGQQLREINLDGTSPLTIAIIRGNEDVIRLFCQTGSFSISTNEVLKTRIEFGDAGSDMDYLEDFPVDEIALKLAVRSGQPEVVENLVKMFGRTDPGLSSLTTCVEVLKLVSPERSLIEYQESNLTRLSRRFPTFNENVEAKFEKPSTDEGRYEQLKKFHLKHDGFLLAKYSFKKLGRFKYMNDEWKKKHFESISADINIPIEKEMKILSSFCCVEQEANDQPLSDGCKELCQQKTECRKIWALKKASALLEKDLSQISLSFLKPKFNSIGSITEGTRLYKASEIDITVQFQALKTENNCLKLLETYEGGKHLCFDKGSPLEGFGDFDQEHNVFVYDHERFFEFFLKTVKESLVRVSELPEWPGELSMTLDDWNPCDKCLQQRKDARKDFPTSIYDPYQHCTGCLPAITYTRVGPCLIFKYGDDSSQVEQVLTMDLIPVLPVMTPGKGVMSLFDAATRILIKKKPEGWLKHLKGVIDKDRVLPESLVKAIENINETEPFVDVSIKLLNYCPGDNHIIRPAQKFMTDKEIKEGGLLKGVLKDVYIRFKAFAEITGSGAKSYVVKKVILSDEMRFQLENPSLNMYERMTRVMKHPELEAKFKDWIGYYNHARQITKKVEQFEGLPRHFPPSTYDFLCPT